MARALLVLGAQFVFTAFAPAQAGKAWLVWPCAADSRPWFAGLGELPQQPRAALVPLAVDLALPWGVFALHWTVAALHGAWRGRSLKYT